MTVLEKKQMLACCSYAQQIKMLAKFPELVGLYRADSERVRLHDEVCRLFGLSKDSTLETTDNMDKIGYDGRILFDKLLELSKISTEAKK